MSLDLPHLLSLQGLSAEQLTRILDCADGMWEINERAIKKVPTLRGRLILFGFFENSTRTRASFEIACKRLSADTLAIGSTGSSVQKGETLLDTCRNLEAMRPDAIIVRHSSSGACHFVAQRTGMRVLNAGDGTNEHPTQGLLDIYTIRRHKKRLAGLKVAIVGDILHSRVAHSNIPAMATLGMDVHVAGPATLMPRYLPALGCTVHHRVEPALEGADVVMMLRIQKERLVDGGAMLPSLAEYARYYGLDRAKFKLARKDALLMHPGPINRGVELTSDLADGAQSVILEQVDAGVAVRMAVLYLLLGATPAGAG